MGKARTPILAKLPKDVENYLKDLRKKVNSQCYIKKLSDNKYEVFCNECGVKGIKTKEEVKVIKATRMCPYCFAKRDKWHRNKYPSSIYDLYLFRTTIHDDNEDKSVGYAFITIKNLEDKEEPRVVSEQVAYWDKSSRGRDRFIARYIKSCMGSICIRYDDDEWRERRIPYYSYYGNGGLQNCFQYIELSNVVEPLYCREQITYKQYLQYNFDTSMFKSNQIELIKHNIFNMNMILAIKFFDLKKVEDVYKHSEYINENCFVLEHRKNNLPYEQLNIYYLEYLDKNHINLNDYIDYLRDLKEMGIKPDKPKDFVFRHETIGSLVGAKKDAKFNKKISNRYKELKVNELYKKEVEIKPLASVEEIYYVAKSLHNCMARLYLKDYAKGETDLYCLWLYNKPFVAIEIHKNKLTQVRADHNSTPETKYRKIVNKWFKGISNEPAKAI